METLIPHISLADRLVSDLDGHQGGPLSWRHSDRPARAIGPDTPAVQLPVPSGPAKSVAEAVLHRRAHRFFGGRPVAGADLHGVCDAAASETPHLSVLVVVNHVGGVAPGVHEYRPGNGSLRMVLPVPAGAPAREEWVLQREFAWSPAVLVMLGSVGSASSDQGTHGYRQLLVDAGDAAHRGWLAAERRNLVGSIFAGLLQPALREVAGVDGWTRSSLVGLAFGHPVDGGMPAW